MARWALLYSEALAVNRLSAPTDTIVNIAIDYSGGTILLMSLKRHHALKHRLRLLMNVTRSQQLYIYRKKKNFYCIRNVANVDYMCLAR